jgi:hypothetical protein
MRDELHQGKPTAHGSRSLWLEPDLGRLSKVCFTLSYKKNHSRVLWGLSHFLVYLGFSFKKTTVNVVFDWLVPNYPIRGLCKQETKERRHTKVFVPQLSKERSRSKVFVSQLSKEQRQTKVFVPQLSNEQRRSKVFVPQLSKQRRRSEVFVP